MKKPRKQRVHHEPQAKKPTTMVPVHKPKETPKKTVKGIHKMRPDSMRKPEKLKNS